MIKPITAAMLSCEGEKLSDREKILFSKSNPLGITLFSRNIKNKEQVKKLIDDVKNAINRDDVLIAVDEEGGRVSRLKGLRGFAYLDQETIVKFSSKYSYMQAILIAEELKSLGININYAPVVDKLSKTQNKVLENRCFSEDPDKIALYGKTMADAYIDMGICPCIKHMPGHFSTLIDPHLNVIESNMTEDEIKKEISYLREFSKYPMVMTSHIKLNCVDNQNPTTLSKEVINRIIREIIGFKGFIISDAIDMHAVEGNVLEKAKKALDAGVDAICYCMGKYEEMYDICNANLFMNEKKEFTPYIPASKVTPELTVLSVICGIFLAVILVLLTLCKNKIKKEGQTLFFKKLV